MGQRDIALSGVKRNLQRGCKATIVLLKFLKRWICSPLSSVEIDWIHSIGMLTEACQIVKVDSQQCNEESLRRSVMLLVTALCLCKREKEREAEERDYHPTKQDHPPATCDRGWPARNYLCSVQHAASRPGSVWHRPLAPRRATRGCDVTLLTD